MNTLLLLFHPKEKVILINSSIGLIGNHLRHHNFGDDLNYYLVKWLTGKDVFNYRNTINIKKHPIYMCIGSLIGAEWMNIDNNIIWGSGARDFEKKLVGKPQKIHAVRGPLTRKLLLRNGIPCPKVFGDPALLLPYLYYPLNIPKKYKLGIIPHFHDLYNNDILTSIKNSAPKDIHVINFCKYNHWEKVLDEILECECIVSSSLHGIIISDAYSIPNAWIQFDKITNENTFKYLDYFASVGRRDMRPKCVSQNSTLDDLVSSAQLSSINFDAYKFIQSCPFTISIPKKLFKTSISKTC